MESRKIFFLLMIASELGKPKREACILYLALMGSKTPISRLKGIKEALGGG